MNGDGAIAISAIGIVILILIVAVLAVDYSFFKSEQKTTMAKAWAYGTAEDAIRIIQIIKNDPFRTSARSVYQGPNADSTYYSDGSIMFKDVNLVYTSYREYRKIRRWLKNNPATESESEPTWK